GAVADIIGDRLNQSCQIVLEAVEAGRLLQSLLVHVKRAIDLDLEAVASLARTAAAPHNLDAFISLIDTHVVAEPAEEPSDEIGELGLACCTVAIPEHKIAVLAGGARPPGTIRRHRVTIDVPDRAELAVQTVAG